MPHYRAGALAVSACALLAATSYAATPGEGTVGPDAPKVTWTGETIASFTVLNPMGNAPEETPCQAPTCDAFALTVNGGGVDLQLSNEVIDDDAIGGIRVEASDGTVTYASGASAEGKPFKLKVPKVKAGSYEIGMVNNFIDGPQAYNGAAELLVKPATPAPAPAPASPAPAPAPSGGGSATAFTMTVKAPKRASAKKLGKAKKIVATVTTSRPVKRISGALRRGSKTVGKGSRGVSSGKVKLTVKVKKLKPGAHKLTVTATDGSVVVTKTLKVKVTR